MSVYFIDAADEDRAAIRRTLEAFGPGARANFDRALARAVTLLRRFPNAGRPGIVEDTREHPLTGQPYLLVYRVRDGHVFILAIIDQRRGDGTAPVKRDHAATPAGRGLGGRPRRLGGTQSAGGI